MAEDIVQTIAEGLDEVVDGDGWGPTHQVAGNYANASPLLLAACRAVATMPMTHPARALCLCAIALAEGGPDATPPETSRTLDELRAEIELTLAQERKSLTEATPQKHPDYIAARSAISSSATDLLEALFQRKIA